MANSKKTKGEPTMDKFKLYEAVKKILQSLDLTPEQYEAAIRKLAELLDI